MPNPVMFSNQEALLEGHARIAWKTEQTKKFFANYEKPANVKFDFRDMYNMIPLLIDIDGVMDMTEADREKYFLAEIQKIEAAFVGTIDPTTGRPDFNTIEPYLRQLYGNLATDHKIDWDDPIQIEHVLSAVLAQQTIGTMVEKFTPEFFQMYSTPEERRQIDTISLTSYANIYVMQNKLAKTRPELITFAIRNPIDNDSMLYNIDLDVTRAVATATEKGGDIILDPTESEAARMHFGKHGEEYTLQDTWESMEWSTEDIAEKYMDALMESAGKSVFEYQLTKGVTGSAKRTDFLFINGKSVSALVEDYQKSSKTLREAELKAAKLLRRALTNGSSVVSIMRPHATNDGKVTFTHQTVKVDFDKYNAAERAGYNIIRRALDFIGIWKIPLPFVSNKERDAACATQMESAKHQEGLRRAEEKFIATYNEKSKVPRAGYDRSIFDAIPEISADKVEEKELGENTLSVPTDEQSRVPLALNKNDIDPPEADRVAPPITQSAPAVQPEKKP